MYALLNNTITIIVVSIEFSFVACDFKIYSVFIVSFTNQISAHHTSPNLCPLCLTNLARVTHITETISLWNNMKLIKHMHQAPCQGCLLHDRYHVPQKLAWEMSEKSRLQEITCRYCRYMHAMLREGKNYKYSIKQWSHRNAFYFLANLILDQLALEMMEDTLLFCWSLGFGWFLVGWLVGSLWEFPCGGLGLIFSSWLVPMTLVELGGR